MLSTSNGADVHFLVGDGDKKKALRWVDEKCRQNGKERSAENRREMLGLALFNLFSSRATKGFFCCYWIIR
uniref:Uncharacterized protein n=1 Tax=Globodera rostochiensis TaxID=31243 RepID=A0A914I2E6_GLORO